MQNVQFDCEISIPGVQGIRVSVFFEFVGFREVLPSLVIPENQSWTFLIPEQRNSQLRLENRCVWVHACHILKQNFCTIKLHSNYISMASDTLATLPAIPMVVRHFTGFRKSQIQFKFQVPAFFVMGSSASVVHILRDFWGGIFK